MANIRFSTLAIVFILGFFVGCSGDKTGDPQVLKQELSKDGFRVLNGDEIRKTFMGNTIKGKSHGKKYVVYFHSAEQNVGIWGDNTDEGFWSIQGDDYCQRWKNWADGKSRCMQVAMKDETIRFLRNDEIYRECRLIEGNAYEF